MKKVIFATSMLLLVNCASLFAQVTIGSNKAPESFSLLELISENKNNGLRLPQLTTAERNAMTDAAFKTNPLSQGLQIFNMTTKCVETWNGTTWITHCAVVVDCNSIIFPPLSSVANFCTGANVANLTAFVGGGVQWYDAITDGNLYENPAEILISGTTYYAEQSIDICKKRVPVVANIVNCSPIIADNGRVTAFTNVMYDFQSQTLLSYSTSGGQATSWQWQVSTSRNGTYVDIPNATFATYTVLPDFMYDYSSLDKTNTTQTPDRSNSTVQLFFKCVLTNVTGSAPMTDANALGMLFIRTNTAGYGIENGVRYLTLNRAQSTTGGGTSIKVALLNLGATPDDGIGLGDYYQWGRIADGHQRTVWSKNASTRANQITPMTGGANTSEPVARNAALQAYDGNGQIDFSNAGFYGNFIYNSGGGDWGTDTLGTGIGGNTDLWGNASNARAGAPVSLAGASPTWSGRGYNNNPCSSLGAGDWYVPSRFDFWDTYRGQGNDNPVNVTTTPYDPYNVLNQNTWSWRGMQTNTNAYGGVIIYDKITGEALFLPAAGFRRNTSGALGNAGMEGYYWNSTFGNAANAYNLGFGSGSVYANYSGYDYRTYGFSVRCVAE